MKLPTFTEVCEMADKEGHPQDPNDFIEAFDALSHIKTLQLLTLLKEVIEERLCILQLQDRG